MNIPSLSIPQHNASIKFDRNKNASKKKEMDTETEPFSFSHWQEATLEKEYKKEQRLWFFSFFVTIAFGVGAVWTINHFSNSPLPVIDASTSTIDIDLSMDISPPVQPISPPQMASLENPPKVMAPPSPNLNPELILPKHEKIHEQIKVKPTISKPIPQPLKPVVIPTATAQTNVNNRTIDHKTSSPNITAHASHKLANWQSKVLSHIAKFKRYPSNALADHQEGTAKLYFVLDRQGHVLSANIVTTSGHAALDKETLNLVHRAEPFPIPPDEISGNSIPLTVPVAFHMSQNDD